MKKRFLALGLSAAMAITLLAGCGSTPESTSSAGDESAPSAAAEEKEDTGSESGVLTDADTPREQTVILSSSQGSAADITALNPYLTDCVPTQWGFRQVVYEPLWDVDMATGEQFPLLAEEMAEALDDTYTSFRVKLREGVTWSDGEPFTADDVVFTAEMLLNSDTITYAASFKNTVKSVTKEDDYNVIIETNAAERKLESVLGNSSTDWNFKILPKHIWENEDPEAFKNEGCVSTGPYVLKGADTNGNWFLFEKRSDWDCSATGIVAGEPAPQYLLWEYFGTVDKQIMAAVNGNCDIISNSMTLDELSVLTSASDEVSTWDDAYPFNLQLSNIEGISFNCSEAPFDETDVRWALTLSLNMQSITLAMDQGSFKVSPIAIGCSDSIMERYQYPMEDWLGEFALSDGYKPFDPDYAANMLAYLEAQGVEGLPSAEDAENAFGIGWWKFDVEEAESLLLSCGFTKDSEGMWLKPDGSAFQITLAVNSGVARELKMAYAAVQCWKDFGIDAAVQEADAASIKTIQSEGSADCWIGTPNVSPVNDLTSTLRKWSSSNIVATGETSPLGADNGSNCRWANENVDEIVGQMAALSSDDPQVESLAIDFFKEVVTDCPMITMVGLNAQNPCMTTYWTGWAEKDSGNTYAYKHFVGGYLKYMLTEIEAK